MTVFANVAFLLSAFFMFSIGVFLVLDALDESRKTIIDYVKLSGGLILCIVVIFCIIQMVRL